MFAFVALVALGAMAANRTKQEMTDIARQQLVGNTTRALQNLKLETLLENESLAMIGDSTVGFAVVSRDKAQVAVVGVSTEAFSPSSMPDGFRWWLDSMTRRLKSGAPLVTRSMTAVNNFVKTHWDQMDPFNGLCPKVGSDPCPTGCVATALAQVLKYYGYPAKSHGTGTYTKGSNNDRVYTVELNSTYNWSKMSLSYNKSSGASNKKAVQQLMYDCGMAVHMQYGKDGSSAYNSDAARACINNFDYDSLAIRYMYRSFYADEEWLETIYSEIARQHPILYGGNDPENGGHAFLLTGNDEQGKLWVNWGWGRGAEVGGYDGFFDLASLTLADTYTFSDYHDMTIGFRPQAQPDEQDELISVWVTTGPYYLKMLEKNSLQFLIPDMFNYHVLYFDGGLYYRFRNTETGKEDYLDCLTLDDDEVVAPLYGIGPDNDDDDYVLDTLDVSSLPAGNYEFTVVSKAKDEAGYKPLRIMDIGAAYSLQLTKADDGTLTVAGDLPPTGIQGVRQTSVVGDSKVYDLYGRRRSSDADGVPPGIYIRNGRKMIVK